MTDLSHISTKELIAALEWQLEAGADALISESAQGLIAPLDDIVDFAPSNSPLKKREAVVKPVEKEDIERLARASDDLDEIVDLVASNRKLRALVRTAYRAFKPRIPPEARLLVLIESPFDEDERSGVLLSGKEGAYFRQMLKSVGIDMDSVGLMAASPWRVPGARGLNDGERNALGVLAERALALSKVEIVVPIGAPALKILDSAQNLRGKNGLRDLPNILASYVGRKGIKILPLPVLNRAMQSAKSKRAVWNDLQILRDALRTE